MATIQEKIQNKVSSEVINTCFEILSDDLVEELTECLLRNERLDKSDYLRINGNKPDAHEQMRSLISCVREKQIPIGGCLLHFLKSKIRVMQEIVERVEKIQKVTTEHILVEELQNLLQSWNLQTCFPCATNLRDDSHKFSITLRKLGEDRDELKLSVYPCFYIQHQDLWRSRRKEHLQHKSPWKLVISDIKVELVELFSYLMNCAKLEELEMKNVRIVGSLDRQVSLFQGGIRNIKSIRITYVCKGEKDVMNAGLSLEYIKELLNGEGTWENGWWDDYDVKYNVYVSFQNVMQEYHNSGMKACNFADEVMKFLSSQIKSIESLNLGGYVVHHDTLVKLKVKELFHLFGNFARYPKPDKPSDLFALLNKQKCLETLHFQYFVEEPIDNTFNPDINLNITTLHLRFTTETFRDRRKYNTLDISRFAVFPNLRNLALGCAILYAKNTSVINVETLSLSHCEFQPDFKTQFLGLFPKLGSCKFLSLESVDIEDFLIKLVSAEQLYFFSVSDLIRKYTPPNPYLYKTLEQVLHTLQTEDYTGKLSEYLVLIRNMTTKRWKEFDIRNRDAIQMYCESIGKKLRHYDF